RRVDAAARQALLEHVELGAQAPGIEHGWTVASRQMASAVEVRELVVRYGSLVAVDRLSFAADAGELVALLGPNGAGKTTTVETLEGYRRPSDGTVRVLGFDPAAQHQSLTPRIGVMLQSGGVYPGMRVIEALRLADRVLIIDHGRLVASGTPAELMTASAGDEIRFGAPSGLDVATLGARVGALVEEVTPGEYRVAAAAAPATVAALTAWLA